MTWRDEPLMALDIETTGVDTETARIVTCCLGAASAATGWKPRNWLFRQDAEIPAEATAIHGITTEHANTHGADPREGLQQIVAGLYAGWANGWPVAVYNAPYDLTLLDRELRRHDLPGLDIRGHVIDALVIDKAADRFRRGSRRLIDVARHHGITLAAEDAHGAEADALTACRLAWKLTAGFRDLDYLHEWQAEQYADQRRSYAAYLAKKGEALDDPSTDWPVRPYVAAAAA